MAATLLVPIAPAASAQDQVPSPGWWFAVDGGWLPVPAAFVAGPDVTLAYVPFLSGAVVELSVDGGTARSASGQAIGLSDEERSQLAEPGTHELLTTETLGDQTTSKSLTFTTEGTTSAPAAPAQTTGRSADPGCPTHVDSRNGNLVSHCGANADSYVPDLANASTEDLRLAVAYQEATLDFCRSDHSGYSRDTQGQHIRNPSIAEPDVLTPEAAATPRAAVVNSQGEVVGAFYNSIPMPNLGSVPRAHQHHGRPKVMLHIWCSTELTEAFQTKHLEQPRLDGPITIGGRPAADVLGTGTPTATDTRTSAP
jgi:hypothetical protein